MWKLIVWSVIVQAAFRFNLIVAVSQCLTLVTLFKLAPFQERSVQFLTGNCTFNPKYFKNFTLTIVDNMMNMDMHLNRPIQRGFKANFDVQLRLANAKNFQSVFTQKHDLCAVTTSVKNSLFKTWFKDMTRNSNFMYNCPVEVGHYYLHNWRMGSSLTHKFLIPGEYRGKLSFFYGKFKTKSYEEALTLSIDSILSN